jgi:hypothetical protein
LAEDIAVPELMKACYAIGGPNFNYVDVFIVAVRVHIHARHVITVYFERRIHSRYT